MDTPRENILWQKFYTTVSLCLSVVFAIVGLMFLFMPDTVALFFNTISRQLGFPEFQMQGGGLFQVLAVGYMYLVTLLACFMYKHPDNAFFPLLLVHGKSTSSLISFYLFFTYQSVLILLTNGIIDGFIALGVFILYRKSRGTQK